MTISLNTIQEYVEDKTIVVICHGERDESIVNDYDIVVRIGTDTKPCDIYVNPFQRWHYGNFKLDKNNFKYCLRLNAEKGDASLKKNYPREFDSCTYFWNKEEHDKLAKEWLKCLRPTTGCSTVMWFTKHTNPKKLDIIGMTFYGGKEKEGPHRPLLEKELIKRLVEKRPYINHL